ncbi:uncharacterized protein LOC134539256 [Bacillus rossius redtenbacheri]|uniref:uncharacterized protein LOC134539256 n=1 Tax=Bacillus rossius redtenbacheri TaxID=93214 RepID=UPI002FDDC359
MKIIREILFGPAHSRIVFNLGVLSGLLALVDFVMSVLYVRSRRALEMDESDYVVRAFEALYMTSAYLSILQFASCMLFVYGSLANKPRWFMPWLLVYTASFLFYLGVFGGASLAMYLGGQAPTSFEVLLRCVISAFLNVYFLLTCFCVMPRMDETKDSGDPRCYYDCMLDTA